MNKIIDKAVEEIKQEHIERELNKFRNKWGHSSILRSEIDNHECDDELIKLALKKGMEIGRTDLIKEIEKKLIISEGMRHSMILKKDWQKIKGLVKP